MNKRGKKWIAALLAGLLSLTMIAGCGNSEVSSTEKTTGKQTEAASNQQSGETEASHKDTITGDTEENKTDISGKYNITWEDMADIHVAFVSMGPVPVGVDAVEAAINEITEEEINTHVNLNVYEIGSYDQQVGLMMSSGETIDLMLTLPGGASGFTTMRSQGQLSDITEVLADYGQAILDTVGDLILATTVQGKIYSVPLYRDMSSSEYIVMRTDVLEDLGMLEKARNMSTMAEYEEILEAVSASDQWSNLSPVVSSGKGLMIFLDGGGCIGENNFSDMQSVDKLGDTLSLVSTNPDGSDPMVRLMYETDGYRSMYERVKNWYDKGYVYKDSATEQSTGSELIKNNVGFSFITDGEYGIEESQTAACGMPVTCVKIISHPITTGSCTKFTWAVPSSAQEPEAAITFLSMMYSDEKITNLLAWGIEGVDYEITDGVAHYIEGNENPAYHMNDYQFGNQFLITPWDGSEANKRAITKEIMESTPVSAYLGFSCDISPVTNEISALTGILSEYRGQIETGMASQEIFDEFIQKLKTSGADKVISCYQEQLNAWLDEK